MPVSAVAQFLTDNGLSAYVCIMDDQGFEDLQDLAALTENDAEFKELVPALGHRTKLKRLLAAHFASAKGTTPSLPGSSVTTTAVAEKSAVLPPFYTAVASRDGHGGDVVVPSSTLFAPLLATTHSAVPSHYSKGVVPAASSSTTAPPLRSTAGVRWLANHGLEQYAGALQAAGYDELSDLSALLDKTDVFEHLIPIAAHRDRMRRSLPPSGAAISTANAMAPGTVTKGAMEWLESLKLPPPCPDPELASTGDAAERASVGSAEVRFTGGDAVQGLLKHFESMAARLSPPAKESAAGSDHTDPRIGGASGVLETLMMVGGNQGTEGGRREINGEGGVATEPAVLSSYMEDGRRRSSSDEEDAEFDRKTPQPRIGEGTAPLRREADRSSGVSVEPFVRAGGRSYDSILLVDNPGQAAARRGDDVPICQRTGCSDSRRCDRLHFREFYVRYEHLKRLCNAGHVSHVTPGVLKALRDPNETVGVCTMEDCNYATCPGSHLSFPLPTRAQALSSGRHGAPQEVPTSMVSMIDCSITEALTQLMQRPPGLLERRQQNAQVCAEFARSQVCVKGSHCWNYHVLPPSFSKFFFKHMPMDRIKRHVRSLAHLPGDSWDVERRLERTHGRSFDVGEALDFMLHTTCRGCAVIFFEAFRSASRYQGHNLLWALLSHLSAHQQTAGAGRDEVMTQLLSAVNNILQLKFDGALSDSSPLEAVTIHMSEAIKASLKKSQLASHMQQRALNQTSLRWQGVGGESGPSCHVFWDFDNIHFADCADLSLFFHCLVAFLTKEGYSAGQSAVHVKAFGTHHSYETAVVDALRDIQVEMVLCSSKKSEEADRVMERAMRHFEGRRSATVVILSSDKDFASISKALTASGVQVLVVHSATAASLHESVLQFSSSRSVPLFDVYAAALRPAPMRPSLATTVNPQTSSASAGSVASVPPVPLPTVTGVPTHSDGGIVLPLPRHAASGSPAFAVVTTTSTASPHLSATTAVGGLAIPPPRSAHAAHADPSGAVSHEAIEAQLAQQPKSILSFFYPEKARADATKASVALPSASIPTSSAAVAVGSSGGGVDLRSILSRLNPQDVLSTQHGLPREVVGGGHEVHAAQRRSLASFVTEPRPPAEHRAWYTILVDSYFVRRGDQHRKGTLPHRGEALLRDMRVYVEMAQLLPDFLPEWFRPEVVLRHMQRRVAQGTSPEQWMSDEHYAATYLSEEFVTVFQVLRYLAVLIEGPSLEDEPAQDPKRTIRLRLQ